MNEKLSFARIVAEFFPSSTQRIVVWLHTRHGKSDGEHYVGVAETIVSGRPRELRITFSQMVRVYPSKVDSITRWTHVPKTMHMNVHMSFSELILRSNGDSLEFEENGDRLNIYSDAGHIYEADQIMQRYEH